MTYDEWLTQEVEEKAEALIDELPEWVQSADKDLWAVIQQLAKKVAKMGIEKSGQADFRYLMDESANKDDEAYERSKQ